MADVINLRRLKKAAERVTSERAAAANRVKHGTPKRLRKEAKTDKQRANHKIDAHKLDAEKPR